MNKDSDSRAVPARGTLIIPIDFMRTQECSEPQQMTWPVDRGSLGLRSQQEGLAPRNAHFPGPSRLLRAPAPVPLPCEAYLCLSSIHTVVPNGSGTHFYTYIFSSWLVYILSLWLSSTYFWALQFGTDYAKGLPGA